MKTKIYQRTLWIAVLYTVAFLMFPLRRAVQWSLGFLCCILVLGAVYIVQKWGAPGLNRDSQLLAGRLDKIVSEAQFDHAGHPTISIGVATYQERESAQNLIKQADTEMFRQKGVKNKARHQTEMPLATDPSPVTPFPP